MAWGDVMKVLQDRQRVQGVRRKIIQVAAFGFTNSHIGNFVGGKIYKGSWKNFCSPGLNCYSCPAAGLGCPIGAMQAVENSPRFGISVYLLGFVLALGVLFGRAICGYVCPFGLLQELLHKIPSPKKHIPKPLTYIKYVLLAVFVLLIPAVVTDKYGIGAPAFCEYICPAGMLEAAVPLLLTHAEYRQAVGGLFALKAVLLAAVLIDCLFIRRFFCKMLCPLGAIYGLLNVVSICRLHFDEKSCVSCGRCQKVCPMDIDPAAQPHSPECIMCGQCVEACPQKALHLGMKPPTDKTVSDTH